MQEDILDALRRGANDEALTLARVAVAGRANDPQAHRALAMALRAVGSDDAALASIDHAIALAPEDADLHFERAGYLLGGRQIEAALAALSQSVQLDPNQFGAYVMQAQLALGRGDIDEADRIGRLLARIMPEHPWTTMIDGVVAMRRGEDDRALSLLSKAAEQAPDDPQVRYALGFAYLKKEHFAFAEQAFRGVLDATPEATGLRILIADLLKRQGHFADASAELAPVLADAATSTPALQRFAGEMELLAGHDQQALPLLRGALVAFPHDPRIVAALVGAWRRLGDFEDARNTLDAALATSPDSIALWRGRLSLVPASDDETLVIADRWIAAMPDAAMPLEVKMDLLGLRGDGDGAEAVAERLLALQPGHTLALTRVLGGLMERDPEAVVIHVKSLLAQAEREDARHLLNSWLALALDRNGSHAEAAAIWITLQADVAMQRLPLPEPAAPVQDWPVLAEATEGAAPVAFLIGVPGSGADRLADVLAAGVQSFRPDRYGGNPPDDLLQNYATMAKLAAGEVDPAEVMRQWREHLPARGIPGGEIVDWLLWWDNALLLVLRAHLPSGELVIALRDPRDMLLDWLAFGTPAQFRMTSPDAASGWLAIQLNQIALLHERALYPHTIVKLDDIANDGMAIATALGDAMQTPIPPPPPGMLGPPRFAAGHWRKYSEALAEPFALLTPVAQRLGYPET
jgi:tetratricopeptide (TPR) repeat protein